MCKAGLQSQKNKSYEYADAIPKFRTWLRGFTYRNDLVLRDELEPGLVL